MPPACATAAPSWSSLGITDEVIAELERMGHQVRRAGGGGMGGYQAIMINPVTGMLHGGTDPRKDGVAVGY